MNHYHHTVIKHRPLYTSSPGDAIPIAEVAFEANDPHKVTSFILDALDALAITKHDSGMLTEFGDITPLDSLPPGKAAERPEWSNDDIKVWIIKGPAPSQNRR